MYQKHDIKRNHWIVLYTHIAQQMTHAKNVYKAAAYLAVMSLSLLVFYRE